MKINHILDKEWEKKNHGTKCLMTHANAVADLQQDVALWRILPVEAAT